MEYARLEVRFALGDWSSGTLITGLAGDGVRGVLVRAADLMVTHTLLKGSRRRIALPYGSQLAGDAQTAVPEGSVRLVKGATVTQGDKRVGRLSAIWCDRATGRIMHILVQPNGGFLRRPAERVLSADEVSELSEGGLLLGAGTASLRALTLYRADREIEADLRLVLAEALHSPSARRAVKLRVVAGQVHVGGLVETEEQVASIRHAAERMRGVRSLVMDLVSTETLGSRVEERLAAVLAADIAPGLSTTGNTEIGAVRVLAEHGIVYLEGRIPTRELRGAMERAALAVPAARVVVNHLEVELDPKPVLASGARVQTASAGPTALDSTPDVVLTDGAVAPVHAGWGIGEPPAQG